MNLAAATGEDLVTTSDIATDALTAFGLSAVTRPKSSGLSLSFRIKNSGDDTKTYDNFQGIQVDGKPLTKGQQYEASRVSVIIEPKPACLETLSMGLQPLTAELDDGTADAKYPILPSAGDTCLRQGIRITCPYMHLLDSWPLRDLACS